MLVYGSLHRVELFGVDEERMGMQTTLGRAKSLSAMQVWGLVVMRGRRCHGNGTESLLCLYSMHALHFGGMKV